MLKKARILAVAAALSVAAPLVAQQPRPPAATPPRASGAGRIAAARAEPPGG